jgi:hypothetical protein
VPVKGEFEQTYFGGPDNPAPCGGVNYSQPYTAIPPTDLAPGSVNTQNINGFLCSSPWVANPPFTTNFGTSEYILGIFQITLFDPASGALGNQNQALVVTNVGVYLTVHGIQSISSGGVLGTSALSLIHTWMLADLNSVYLYPGQSVSFIEINGVVYFTGLMLTGIYAYGAINGSGAGNAFIKATSYVAGRFIAELAGRLVVASCTFPGGGGTGIFLNPTIAWSGVGIFGQAWDGNPAHDVWNAANQTFFNGNIGGFNLLGDVPDQITGMGTVGQSIIIVRQNGLTQQDPNSTYSNSGIQPYNWYHMWASAQGVGGYVGSVAQWGQTLTFRSYDNIYSLSMSAGLTALGTKIIPRIVADEKAVLNSPSVFLLPSGPASQFYISLWNFASNYNLDGQLHYVLTASAYLTNAAGSVQQYPCFAYDLNMADGSWHVWDFTQYYQGRVVGAGFLSFSCPIVTVQINMGAATNPAICNVDTSPIFFLFGSYTSLGTLTALNYRGGIFQLVPFDYDFNSSYITTYSSNLYLPVSLPSTTILFRGETISLGHKISTRRLRIQADNAPLPFSVLAPNPQQQAQVTFTGASKNSVKQSPVINMQGNLAPTGLAIQTYYGDAVLSDEMVQPSLTSVFSAAGGAIPWQTLCAFRIASASLIGNDATGTTQ